MTNADFLPQEMLENFECQRCNECCRQAGFVYLETEEAEKIAAFVKLDVYEFTKRYCEVLDRHWLTLKKDTGETCIFLTETGCSVHPAKPAQCKDFPVKWRTVKSLEYCLGLKELIHRFRPQDDPKTNSPRIA